MKKVIFVLAIAVVLVAVIAAPALAAKPNLVFVTHITSDGAQLPGNSTSGVKVPIGGLPGVMHVLGLTGTMANPGLMPGSYAFTLQATDEQVTALTTYFSKKAWWAIPNWHDQIVSEINGDSPFFFLKYEGGAYSLVDNFKLSLGIGTALTIDDDYPLGSYSYAGTLVGSNGARLPMTVVMKVVTAH
jgi:hypothetical protein